MSLLFSIIAFFLPFELVGISVDIHYGEPAGGPDSMTYTATGHSFYSERPMDATGLSFMVDLNAISIELKNDTYHLYISEFNEKTMSEIGQTVSYNGISLNVYYPLFDWKGIRISAITGPEYKYGGENMGLGIPDSSNFFDLKQHSPKKNSMWNWNLGAELRSPYFFNRLAIFLNAGYSYHFGFSNGDIHNYYTEHPLIFSINGGIRWRFYFKSR